MLSALTTTYLFLGGTGAGAVFVVCCLDLVWAREPFGVQAASCFDQASAPGRALALSLAVGAVCLVAGALCLVFDLGRMDRVGSLATNPSLTYLTFGAFSLAVLIALAAFLCAVRVLYMPIVSRTLVIMAESFAIVAALGVMAYTGLLLQSLSSVDAWNTPLVPVLFVLSSLSCGIAVVLLCAYFDGRAAGTLAMPWGLVAADAVLLVLEAVAAVAYCALVPSEVSFASFGSSGVLVLAAWWFGFAFCGVAGPFALEAAARRRLLNAEWRQGAFACLALAAALVLAGGACLRFCVANAGGPSDLGLRAPVAQAVGPSNSEGEWVL